MTNQLSKPIVMDNGTALSKIGFAGNDKPHIIIPTMPRGPLIAKPKIIRPTSKMDEIRETSFIQKSFTIGKSLLERGIISDWIGMERFWQSIFYEILKVEPSNHPIILAEAPLNPEANREKMAQIMYEKFNVPALLIIMQPSLSLYASGRTSGCIVDIGEGVTKIVPISEGYIITHAIQIMDIAGQEITKNLLKLLRESGYPLTTTTEKNLAIDIKETFCYIASDFDDKNEHMKNSPTLEKMYHTPDGEAIILKSERYLAPECLFKPYMIGKEINSLHEKVIEAISLCDMNLHKELYSNIILSGGSSKFPGFKERLEREISKLVPNSMEVSIYAPSERELSTWVGGSIIGSLPSFSQIAMTKEQYFNRGGKYLI
jgi:actin-related protein